MQRSGAIVAHRPRDSRSLATPTRSAAAIAMLNSTRRSLQYGVTDRDDARYIYSTFPIVEREEKAAYDGR